ncbi:MAG: glycogen/starch synthase [Microgenomates group bacterium]|nr:glycogen/starch synthase [Microgenomates group bacterium]
MKVLFVVWEVAPFFKVGGLGDVARSLPIALYNLKVDIRLIVPYYKAVNLFGQPAKKIADFQVEYDKQKENTSVHQISFIKNDIPVYLVKNEKYLDVPFKETFAFFNLAVVEILKKNLFDWRPQIIHGNDHHSGLIPLLIRHQNLPFKTLITIHNLENQGKVPLEIGKKMGIDHHRCQIIKWESRDKDINFLFEAVVHADLINTVSPTYAKEIIREEYGAGLDKILKDKKESLCGILNGIDYDFRNSLKNNHLLYHYDASLQTKNLGNKKIYSLPQGKKLNKLYLQKKLGLKVNHSIPLIGFIGRFSPKQKGLDLLFELIKKLAGNYQFVILGKGKEEWEKKFAWFNQFYPKSVSCNFVFNEALAAQIYAGADFLIIPSKYEPCGLIQMIAMNYGTLPIARATGGLKDSIKDGHDGYLFQNYSLLALEKAVKRAVNIWKNFPRRHLKMMQAAMTKDFSWETSAKKYLELYEKLIKK